MFSRRTLATGCWLTKNSIRPWQTYEDGVSPGWTRAVIVTSFRFFSEELCFSSEFDIVIKSSRLCCFSNIYLIKLIWYAFKAIRFCLLPHLVLIIHDRSNLDYDCLRFANSFVISYRSTETSRRIDKRRLRRQNRTQTTSHSSSYVQGICNRRRFSPEFFALN